jgi:hypothetical protein
LCIFVYLFCADFGIEESRNLDNASADMVEAALRELVEKGDSQKRFPPQVRYNYIEDANTFDYGVWNESLLPPPHLRENQ